MSNLFAQAALSAAFVPVFTDLLQQGRKREAFKLASTLFWIILIALGAITALGILLAGVIMPLFTGTQFSGADNALTAGLAQVLFPVVLLLGLTGLLVGILQSYDEFSVAGDRAGGVEPGHPRPADRAALAVSRSRSTPTRWRGWWPRWCRC